MAIQWLPITTLDFGPPEVLIWNGKAQLIRKRDTLDDLLRNQVVAEI